MLPSSSPFNAFLPINTLSSLPIGIGGVFSTVITGKLQDRAFKATRLQVELKKRADKEASGNFEKEESVDLSKRMDPNDLLDFPLEHARLRFMPIGKFSRSLAAGTNVGCSDVAGAVQ